jgi:peptidoglycan hydrolase-like protein with peptidoglycan-binding domain
MFNRIARSAALAAVPALLAGTALLATSGAANAAPASIGWEYAPACQAHGTITYNGMEGIPAETIQYGSTGDCVKFAQAALYDWGRLPSTADIDGQFGPQTQAATIAQQNFCHIQNNGQIGKMTWYCLMNAD